MIQKRPLMSTAVWLALAAGLCGYDCCDTEFPSPLLAEAGDDPVFRLDPRGFAEAYKAHPEIYALFEGRTLDMDPSHPFCHAFSSVFASEQNAELIGCRIALGSDLDGARCACEGSRSDSGIVKYSHALVELRVKRAAVFSSREEKYGYHVTSAGEDGDLMGPDCFAEDGVVLRVDSLPDYEDPFHLTRSAAFSRAFQAGVPRWEKDYLDLVDDIDRRVSDVLGPLAGCPEGTRASQSCDFPERGWRENAFRLCCRQGELLHGPWWEYQEDTVQLTRDGVQGQRRVEGEFRSGQRAGSWILRDGNGNQYASATLVPIAGNTPRKKLPKPKTSYVGMVHVPAGRFQSGCLEAKAFDCEDQRPPERAYVAAFYIDKREVTEGEYMECVDAGSCDRIEGMWGSSDRPVTDVSPAEAQKFCRYKHKRLPSELEWEKAARGGCEFYDDCAVETRLFPWGDAPPTPERAVLEDPETGSGMRAVGTLPAGASPYGALDMMGNAGEWTVATANSIEHRAYLERCVQGDHTADRYRPTHAYDSYSPTLLADLGYGRSSTSRDEDIGFRCAYTPPPASASDAPRGRSK